MKKLLSLVLAMALVLSLSSASAQTLKKIVVGATPTPHAVVLELVKDDLAALGYKLEIVVFTEYPLPNPALAAGELDANYFQHLLYLESDWNSTAPEDKKLVGAFGVHYEPYALYPGKTKALSDLKEGGVITITNDPSNETRALFLLQEAGLITLPEDATQESSLTVLDIVSNPLKLDIKEVDASSLPATLLDADFAVINGNYALDAGLSPARDAIFLESADNYTNYVVVRQEDADADFVKALESVLHTKKVYDFLLTDEKFRGGVIPTFTPAE